MQKGCGNILGALKDEFERILRTIKKPEYDTEIRGVYRVWTPPELAKNYPVACLTVMKSYPVMAKAAQHVVARTYYVRVMLIVREDVHMPVDEAANLAASDFENALAYEFHRAQENVTTNSGASLVAWDPPAWEEIQTSAYHPYGTATCVVAVDIRYPRGEA
jgi:hypothetical protein